MPMNEDFIKVARLILAAVLVFAALAFILDFIQGRTRPGTDTGPSDAARDFTRMGKAGLIKSLLKGPKASDGNNS